MKFKVEVEIDWLENEELDQTLRDEVVRQILSSVKEKSIQEVKTLVHNQAKNLTHGWIMQELSKFADSPLRITDKYGDTIEHHDSLRDMFKIQFDQFFDAAVDSKGNLLNGSCGHGKKLRRIDSILDNMANNYLKKITEDMDRTIKRTVDDKMQEKIREKIVKHTTEQLEKLVI